MKDHWTSITYTPKIKGVQDGTITQSIRIGRKYHQWDRISFHGWQGRPYYSPWSFRTRMFPIILVFEIDIFPTGIQFYNFDGYPKIFKKWNSLDDLAEYDGIDPAKGIELGRILCNLNKIPLIGVPGQIIRWRFIENES